MGDVTTFTASIASGVTTSGVLTYDPVGHVTTRTAMSGAPLESYGWNAAAGERTSQKRSGESSVTYAYIGDAHLSNFTKPAGARGQAATITATYTYDALGQRVRSVVQSASVVTSTSYTYSGIQLLSLSAGQSLTPTASVTTTWSVTYLYDGEGRPYSGVYMSGSATPTVFGMVTTDRGDVVELLDKGGAACAAYRYDAWGRPLTIIAPGSSTLVTGTLAAAIATRQPLRYAGYCFDTESGLYYLSARYYDPATMQFITKDPAKSDGEASAYQYCAGDPVDKVDPTGLRTVWRRYVDAPTVVIGLLWASAVGATAGFLAAALIAAPEFTLAALLGEGYEASEIAAILARSATVELTRFC
jgi:RHS repeat-associated protein